jgi:integrase/recombinase XerD
MAQQTTPKQMARRLARVLRDERPDYSYLKKVFQHIRALLAVKPGKVQKRLPHLLTDQELVAFYETVWQARDPVHMILIKLLIFTGLRNAELANVQLSDVDLDNCQIRVDRGKGGKDRSVLFPGSFRGELAQYLRGQQERGPCIYSSPTALSHIQHDESARLFISMLLLPASRSASILICFGIR